MEYSESRASIIVIPFAKVLTMSEGSMSTITTEQQLTVCRGSTDWGVRLETVVPERSDEEGKVRHWYR